ncbi:MAG: hypothetical protein K2K96_08480 [Lachnospiraceae bacterium]|nr:hypothetical protein [Lachnospiraceae bacterium]
MITDKKKIKVLIVFMLLLLITGCSTDGNQGEAENDISDTEISEDQTAEQPYTLSENEARDVVSENETLETIYHSEESYVDNIPKELQNLLIYYNDGIEDERDEYWKIYWVDCEQITEENMEDYPIEDIKLDASNVTYLSVIDIDGDGEDEYFHTVINGTSKWSYLCFHKNIEGVWETIEVNNAENGNVILYYEDRYYVFSGECLTWWNDEVEIPWQRSMLIGGDPCWNHLTIEQIPTE